MNMPKTIEELVTHILSGDYAHACRKQMIVKAIEEFKADRPYIDKVDAVMAGKQLRWSVDNHPTMTIQRCCASTSRMIVDLLQRAELAPTCEMCGGTQEVYVSNKEGSREWTRPCPDCTVKVEDVVTERKGGPPNITIHVPEGYRYITEEERKCLPNDSLFLDPTILRWVRSVHCGCSVLHLAGSVYATKNPLPEDYVDLEPSDIPPGSYLRRNNWAFHSYTGCSINSTGNVELGRGAVLTYGELRRNWTFKSHGDKEWKEVSK